LANHKSALKRHRQSLKRRARNKAVKTRVKNMVKDVRQAVQSGDKEQALSALRQAESVLDKAAGKGVLHKRTAARKVSRLNDAVRKLS
jgi:small subunit ribosomal protein S20